MELMELSEEQAVDLLKKIAAREPKTSEEAIKTLYLAFNLPIRKFIWRAISHDSSLIDEVTQDTFMEVWDYPDRFRGEAKFKTWLFSIARHKALDYLRKHNKDFEPLEKVKEKLVSTEMPLPEQIQEIQVKKAILTCLETLRANGKLSIPHCEVLHLAYVEGQTLVEIATILNCLESNIKTRLHYARLRIKNCLQLKLFGGSSHG
jgi:RNA polymerase sigma-70 factor, ECF subfamily